MAEQKAKIKNRENIFGVLDDFVIRTHPWSMSFHCSVLQYQWKEEEIVQNTLYLLLGCDDKAGVNEYHILPASPTGSWLV